MGMRNYMIRIDDDLDDQLRQLRKFGYLPAVLIRQAVAKMVTEKLKEAKGREK